MEFISRVYKRSVGKVTTTSDGHNYVHSKMTEDYIYPKCALFRSGCKGTGKLHRIILKQKLSDGDLTPWEFLKSMSCTVGNINTQNIDLPSDSEISEDDGDENII